jgi:hypothetical protein
VLGIGSHKHLEAGFREFIRSVIALIVPPFPAAPRRSYMKMTLAFLADPFLQTAKLNMQLA